MVAMSQKSSVPQVVKSVSQVLMPDSLAQEMDRRTDLRLDQSQPPLGP
jgi:hypothetical protein